ncbi:MAG: small multi-drug export protein [Solobacterium sp.]|nr:small multi-drug export protein [Solobacterium sp.]
MNTIINWFMNTIGQYISAELSVFLVSMIPLVEERGGLIVARLLGIPMWRGIACCVAGNILPIPFILFFIKKIFHWMSAHHMSGIVAKMEEKAAKNKPKIDRYGFWGLALFVGIPLPGTGAWTGSLVAALFDMDLKKASLSILIGIALAAFIMTVFSYQLLGAVIS